MKDNCMTANTKVFCLKEAETKDKKMEPKKAKKEVKTEQTWWGKSKRWKKKTTEPRTNQQIRRRAAKILGISWNWQKRGNGRRKKNKTEGKLWKNKTEKETGRKWWRTVKNKSILLWPCLIQRFLWWCLSPRQLSMCNWITCLFFLTSRRAVIYSTSFANKEQIEAAGIKVRPRQIRRMVTAREVVVEPGGRLAKATVQGTGLGTIIGVCRPAGTSKQKEGRKVARRRTEKAETSGQNTNSPYVLERTRRGGGPRAGIARSPWWDTPALNSLVPSAKCCSSKARQRDQETRERDAEETAVGGWCTAEASISCLETLLLERIWNKCVAYWGVFFFASLVPHAMDCGGLWSVRTTWELFFFFLI